MIDFIANNLGILIALWLAGIGAILLFFYAARKLEAVERKREDESDI